MSSSPSRRRASYDARLGKQPAAAITPGYYGALQKAYEFFNRELFGGKLPAVLITLQRHARARGYFSPERFAERTNGDGDAGGDGAHHRAHELALNPDHFGRADREILGTLAHEMAHVWQRTHGEPPRRGYHNRQWANKMKEIGLQPSHTGEPGGREVGPRMAHYIVSGGAYDRAYGKLAASGFELKWRSRPEDKQRRAKRESKTKYTCPDCGLNAWAKPGAALICGTCYGEQDGEILVMLPADAGCAAMTRANHDGRER